MSNIEKFGLVTSVVGLVADIIALVTFFGGMLWQPVTSNPASGSIPPLFRILIGFTIIYGWAAISWILTRRRFLLTKKEIAKKKTFDQIVGSAITGIGLCQPAPRNSANLSLIV